MKIEQLTWDKEASWKIISSNQIKNIAQLVLVFGHRECIELPEKYAELQDMYPHADIVFCSTSGEIIDIEVKDDSIVATAIYFENTPVKAISASISDSKDSYLIGKTLSNRLNAPDLRHILVFSDGQIVNGSRLVQGLNDAVHHSIPIAGGLASDNARFERTSVGLNCVPKEGNVVAIGFYGENFQIGHGSMGGWSTFGPERRITKSQDNVLYELDHASALGLYKNYLGDQAKELPGAALLFPLCIRTEENGEMIVRTILSIDEENQSMIFAGDMPVGSMAQLMYANFDNLIDGASVAAEKTLMGLKHNQASLALLISCVGRKLVLGARTEDEVEEVRLALGNNVAISGFYSNGEISPLIESPKCELYNQTMTITTYSEKV